MQEFVVSGADRRMLENWLKMPTLSHELGLRARVILASAQGEAVRAVAHRFDISPNTVAACRRRYREGGIAALRTKARSGRPRVVSAAKEQAVVAATLKAPHNATHWSARRLARQVGLSRATVHRIWQKYGLQPHRVETFKFSTDPDFETKFGGYRGTLSGPAGARTGAVRGRKVADSSAQPHPAGAADVARFAGTNDPRLHSPWHHQSVCCPGGRQRQGPWTLLSAPHACRVHRLPKILGQALSRPRIAPHLRQLWHPQGIPRLTQWLKEHSNFHLHFTPTSASWLNLVERWFGLITSQAIRRGSFDSVKSLERAIVRYLADWNQNPRPFRWTKSAADIKRSLKHVTAIYDTGH